MENELYYDENFSVVSRPEDLKNSLENQLVAMGKALMRAKKNLTETEYKLLIICLTKINWSKDEKINELELDKKEISDVLHMPQDKNLSVNLRRIFTNMMKNSMISFTRSDDEYEDGMLVKSIRSTRGSMLVKLNEDYIPLLSNLLKDRDFVTIWSNDIYSFNSKFAYLLFEELRLHCNTQQTNWRTYSTKELKELFGIPKTGKGSYMRSEESGGFNRNMFEKQVLDVAIDEINEGQMIKILPILGSKEIKKGKCYEKIKKNGYIVGYQFKYMVKSQIKKIIIDSDDIPGQATIEDFLDK